MITDLSQTKTQKSKTQPSQEVNYPPLQQTPEPYVNPIIKHTLDSLPAIYGSFPNRKRKYNIFIKNKYQLSSVISRSNAKSVHPNQKLYNRLNQLDQQRQRGHSCLEMNKFIQVQKQREEITKTVAKHIKYGSKSPQHFNKQQSKSQCTATPKHKRLINLQLMHSLSKPREYCNKQYCSCKSLFNQYKEQIKKKLKSKHSNSSSRRQNLSRIQLPRLSVQLNKRSPSKIDDQESKHKVNFKSKINTLDQEAQHTNCIMCNKSQKTDSLQLKGILGLIHKKQLEEKKKKLALLSMQNIQNISNTQNIGIQSDIEIMVESRIQDYGIQADLVTSSKKKLSTIDQEINTDFQQENKNFKYLENNRNLIDSSVKHKKQPLEHLSHLKEVYKYKKRPAYQSKYDEDQNENQNQNYQCDHQDSDISPNKKKRNSQLKRLKKSKPDQQQEQFDINIQSDSMMSEKSLINHLTKALGTGRTNKSTIFKALKKRQTEQEQSQADRNPSKNKRRSKSKGKHKNMNLIDQNSGLFAIPEEQEYVSYLKSYKPISKDFKIKSLIKSQNFKILKYNDTLYFGETDAENKKNGKALLISPKQIFEGVYQNGIKMSGCERNIDGVYIGQFLNGQRHGQGKWLWNNGQFYQGEWRLGTKNGQGIWKSPKGDSYQGQWLLNRQQGKGIHRHKSSVYEGQFVQSLKEGMGNQKFINGDLYVGQYSRGKPHGKGRYTWKNGTYYEGDFKNGLRQGFGKWFFSPKAFYEGQFKGDFKHGKGKQHFDNGDQYEGQYFQGVKTSGILIQASTGNKKEVKNNLPVKKDEKKQQKQQEEIQEKQKEQDLKQKRNKLNKQESDIEKFLKNSKIEKQQKKSQVQKQLINGKLTDQDNIQIKKQHNYELESEIEMKLENQKEA